MDMSHADRQEAFEKALEKKDKELKAATALLARMGREEEKRERFNEHLRKQVELLNAKLHLQQKVVGPEAVSHSTQTEPIAASTLGTESGLSKCSVCGKRLESQTSGGVKIGWVNETQGKKSSVADMVREAAEDNEKANDYVYDEKSKTYYSRSTGWYYYPDRELFYDPNTKTYKRYDKEKKSYEFYSALEEKENKGKKRKKDKSDQKSETEIETKTKKATPLREESDDVLLEGSDSSEVEVIEAGAQIEEEEEGEEGELSSSSEDDDNEDATSEEEEELKEDKPLGLNEVAPIRMIVLESDTLDEGSLLLVSCLGATIGNNKDCDVYITDDSVNESHAEIVYNELEQTYSIKNCENKENTFVNESLVENNVEVPLKHGDVLRLGSSTECCRLLLHIHEGKDVTCIHCEPGCVQANLKSLIKTVVEPSVNSEAVRRAQLKLIKKRYGLAEADYCQSEASLITKGFTDRANERRHKKGSDNPYEKTVQASVKTSLKKGNKGYNLLSKMGWTEGQGLGKSSSGATEPIEVALRPERAGLGCESSLVSTNSVKKVSSAKAEKWKKAKDRFDAIS